MSAERVQLSHETLVATLGAGWPFAEVSSAAELLAGGDGRFPRGIRSLPDGLISAIQRERLLAAMLRASSELGYHDLTVQDVIERAGVSRPTFYEHFENKEDCFLAAFETASERLCIRLEAAASEGGDRWQDRLRLALEELLGFVSAEPEAARMLIVEARASCPTALVRRDELLDRFATCIDAQVRASIADPPPSAMTAAGIVGGIEALLYARIDSEDLADLESLLPPLMHFAILPYEGFAAAYDELGAPAAA